MLLQYTVHTPHISSCLQFRIENVCLCDFYSKVHVQRMIILFLSTHTSIIFKCHRFWFIFCWSHANKSINRTTDCSIPPWGNLCKKIFFSVNRFQWRHINTPNGNTLNHTLRFDRFDDFFFLLFLNRNFSFVFNLNPEMRCLLRPNNSNDGNDERYIDSGEQMIEQISHYKYNFLKYGKKKIRRRDWTRVLSSIDQTRNGWTTNWRYTTCISEARLSHLTYTNTHTYYIIHLQTHVFTSYHWYDTNVCSCYVCFQCGWLTGERLQRLELSKNMENIKSPMYRVCHWKANKNGSQRYQW